MARDFFAHYLPPSVADTLKLDSLTLQSGSFIDSDLQEQFADLLYQVDAQDGTLAYLYLLLEHKSYPDPLTPFQLLRYMVRIWERDMQASEPLRPIIPTVVYHGRSIGVWQRSLAAYSMGRKYCCHTGPNFAMNCKTCRRLVTKR
ncbi:MAG: Rpn family recombination-promoting nuclease/putative transposase [Chloroflexi bacterium]|nr:Rpn family recombination-promoting nuclease/putative transposase [Chloroflexota bacterium]